MADLEKFGALWNNVNKNGNDYMTGIIGGKKVIIFTNKNKKGAKHPDWNVYLQPPKDQLPPRRKENDDNIPF